eukprot:gene965-1047_t
MNSEEQRLHADLWQAKQESIGCADDALNKIFWPQVMEEIRHIDVHRENFAEQAIPIDLTHEVLVEEGLHQSNTIPVDPSACCTLSKACEVVVLELALLALQMGRADNKWRIKKEDVIAALRSHEDFDILMDHSSC